jgi:hypothetical protein
MTSVEKSAFDEAHPRRPDWDSPVKPQKRSAEFYQQLASTGRIKTGKLFVKARSMFVNSASNQETGDGRSIMKTLCGIALLMLLAVGAYGQEKPQPIDCKRDLPVALEKAIDRAEHPFQPFTITDATQVMQQALMEAAQRYNAESDWLHAVRDKCGEKTLTVYGDLTLHGLQGTTPSIDLAKTFPGTVTSPQAEPVRVRIPEDVERLQQEVKELRDEVEKLKKPPLFVSGTLGDPRLYSNTLPAVMPMPGTGWPMINTPSPPCCCCCPLTSGSLTTTAGVVYTINQPFAMITAGGAR